MCIFIARQWNSTNIKYFLCALLKVFVWKVIKQLLYNQNVDSFFCLFFLNNWATMHKSQPCIFGVLFKSCLNCKLHSICILGVSCCCQTCLMLSSVGLQTLPCFLFQVFTSHDSWSSRPSHNWNPSPSYCNTSSKTRTSAQRQWANACVSLPFCSSPWWINLWELTPSKEESRTL